MKDKKLYEIVGIIRKDHLAQGKRVNFAAVPYLDALATCSAMSDNYVAEKAGSLVAYALANLGTWRGPVAREVKAELNRRHKEWLKSNPYG